MRFIPALTLIPARESAKVTPNMRHEHETKTTGQGSRVFALEGLRTWAVQRDIDGWRLQRRSRWPRPLLRRVRNPSPQ